ncbi:MAG: 4'-phosphopantetheinyl transferase superfamily protein, partial [Erysipelotrichia bacterium]|nr:4'-phosphopantetheinyl transferase superfamily protein [Erysipelotrichia bacterium]
NDRSGQEYLAGRFAAKEAIFKATQDINYLK